MEYTYERFLTALKDTIEQSRKIAEEDSESYFEAMDFPLKKVPEEIRDAWSHLLEAGMSDSLEFMEIFDNSLECIEGIICGKASEEVNNLMRNYFEVVGQMYKFAQEKDTISRNKQQYEMEALEDSLGYEGYYIFGGYEAYCNMVSEVEFEE